MSAPDIQRQAVYDAENMLATIFDQALEAENPLVTLPHGITVALPPEARFASIASVQTYVNRVLRHPIIEMAYPHMATVPVTVRRRRGSTKAHYEDHPGWSNPRIAVHDGLGKDWAMRELVVLHEVAHHLAYNEQHGPGFAEAYVILLRTVMGPEAGLALQILFDEAGIDSRPKQVIHV